MLVTDYICISGASTRDVAKAMFFYTWLREIMFQSGSGFRNITLRRMSSKRKKIAEYIVDETLFKVGSELVWLWVAMESKNHQILALAISKERNMFVTERFLPNIVRDYGKHPVSTH